MTGLVITVLLAANPLPQSTLPAPRQLPQSTLSLVPAPEPIPAPKAICPCPCDCADGVCDCGLNCDCPACPTRTEVKADADGWTGTSCRGDACVRYRWAVSEDGNHLLGLFHGQAQVGYFNRATGAFWYLRRDGSWFKAECPVPLPRQRQTRVVVFSGGGSC